MVEQGKPIVILTVPFGSAHQRTADALTKAWSSRTRPAPLRIVGLEEYLPHRMIEMLTRCYLNLILHAPVLFRFIYAKGREPGVSERLLGLAVRLFRPTGRRLSILLQSDPAVWVSTHPLTSVLARAADNGTPELAVLITDHHFHAFWCFPGATSYFVGRPEMRDALVRRRIPRGSVRLTGIPIDPCFVELTSKAESERQLGLPPADFRILLLGGGLGIGPMEDIVRKIVELGVGIQVVVVAGRNIKLKEKLASFGNDVVPLGYVDTIPLLMRASDLCLTKPGGLTLAEAAATALPTVLFGPLPGHEEANTEILVREGIAFRLAKVENASQLIHELLKRPGLLRRMGQKMSRYGRPRAAYDVADALEALWKKRDRDLTR